MASSRRSAQGLERGTERERLLEREAYFSDNYFSLRQLGSVAHQLHLIWKMRPRNVLEIGPGNGLVSVCLRQAGIPVTTVDINPHLEPDICAPLHEVPSHIQDRFDLVLCCEVLEHMPLAELDDNLDVLRSMGQRLLLTLPNSSYSLGFGGLAFIPRYTTWLVDLNIDLPLWKRPIKGTAHFWEVGYSKGCHRRDIMSRLRARYERVRTGRFAMNPYHLFFTCESDS